MTTVLPRGTELGSDAARDLSSYEYTLHSHMYATEGLPAAKFSYDMSPVQIVVREERRRWYHFLTMTCAIVGGVFTVAGILDSLLHSTLRLARKIDLGKQT